MQDKKPPLCVLPPRKTHVHSRRVGDAGQRRVHGSGAQQPNTQQQELLPEEERHQVSAQLSLTLTHTHTHTHTHTDSGICVCRSPPRPSPGGLHYSDEDICNNYNGAVLTESTTLTEKHAEVSESEVPVRPPARLSVCLPVCLPVCLSSVCSLKC